MGTVKGRFVSSCSKHYLVNPLYTTTTNVTTRTPTKTKASSEGSLEVCKAGPPQTKRTHRKPKGPCANQKGPAQTKRAPSKQKGGAPPQRKPTRAHSRTNKGSAAKQQGPQRKQQGPPRKTKASERKRKCNKGREPPIGNKQARHYTARAGMSRAPSKCAWLKRGRKESCGKRCAS